MDTVGTFNLVIGHADVAPLSTVSTSTIRHSSLRAVLEHYGTDKDREDSDSISNGERNDDVDEVEKFITPSPSHRVFCRFRGT